jgi:hypothetical protein
MQDRIFGDREKAMENSYFRDRDAKLVERLRQEAKLDDIGRALADKLQVDNPDLLLRARQAGVTADTAPAFFLAPMIQVAWAEGSVRKAERQTVLRIARERGIEKGSPAYAQLTEWLNVRPPDEFFDTALDVMRYGYSVLPAVEREERIKRIVDACHQVAEASGSEIARLIGLGDAVSRTEEATLEAINNRLRIRR